MAQTVLMLGEPGPVAVAVVRHLVASGAREVTQPDPPPQIVLASTPLLADGIGGTRAVVSDVRRVAQGMAGQGGGRIVFILSALGLVPMRRHFEQSMAMAAAVAAVRGLAMEFGPYILVNGVALGAITDHGEAIAGDRAQRTHTALARDGTLAEAVGPVLFFCDPDNSYTTGQVMAVDGGWSTGFGRSF